MKRNNLRSKPHKREAVPSVPYDGVNKHSSRLEYLKRELIDRLR